MTISAAIALATIAAARRHGVGLAALLEHSGLGELELDNPTNMVPLDEFHRLVRAALVLTRAPTLGLHVGELAPLGMLHVVGHLLASSRTLRDAHHQFMRFSPLVEPGARYRLIESGEQGCFGYTPAHAPLPELARFHAETSLAVTYQLCRELLLVRDGAIGVRFATEAPPHAREVERFFGCPVVYGQPENQLVFPRRVLDEPLLHADAGVFDSVRARAEQLLAQGGEEALAARVLRLLRWEPRLGGIVEADVAARLHLAARTLRRKLGDAGKPFSSLLDDVRRERASAQLRLPGASVKQVVEDLGFSEPSALHRAFKRWTGTTIGAWRERELCGASRVVARRALVGAPVRVARSAVTRR